MLSAQVQEQQRQIDQNCRGIVALAEAMGAKDGGGFNSGNEYCFFWGDYDRGIAIVGEFDGDIHYSKKPRLVIIHHVSEEVMQSWEKAELCYGYKKIR